MGIENENFVLVGSLNTLSLVYMTKYYNNKKMIHTFMFQKHIHKVKFYTGADDSTQVLLVMLVTNIMSELCGVLSRCVKVYLQSIHTCRFNTYLPENTFLQNIQGKLFSILYLVNLSSPIAGND